LRQLWRAGKLDDRLVEVEVSAGGGMQVMSVPGMEGMEMQMQDMFSKVFPKKKKTKKVSRQERLRHPHPVRMRAPHRHGQGPRDRP
jgi:ATP-dependent protease HslVU (ClpYQ) ATPase subunit